MNSIILSIDSNSDYGLAVSGTVLIPNENFDPLTTLETVTSTYPLLSVTE